MAPAVTSDTAPCSRAPCLLTSDPTSLISMALVNPGEISVSMNSQVMPGSQDDNGATADAVGSVPFHPFARLPATRPAVSSEIQRVSDSNTKQELHLVDGTGQVLPEMLNGVGVNPSQSLSSLSLSNACRVSLKSAPQRTVSIVIKNNGACGAGIVSNSMHRPVVQTCVTSGNCNGGSCPEANASVPAVHITQTDGIQRRFVARPVTSLHRMFITPRMPNRDSTSLFCDVSDTGNGTDCIDPVTKCDAGESVHVEQLQVLHSKSDAVPSIAQSDEATLDTVLARQRNLVSRADRTLQRLRRLQSREANSSVRRQVAGLVSALRRSTCQSVVSNDMSAAVRSTPDLKSMSTLELVGFVRQMQSSEAVSTLSQASKTGTLQLSVCPDMADTADLLSSNLRHLESAIDSDATESSSGGETDDEVEQSPAASDEYVVVSDSNNRMKTKLTWASERAMIASRWTWLQAQVSDLEYRIRQQSELYRQLRSLKGAVTLHDPCSDPSSASTELHLNSETAANDSSRKIPSSSGVSEPDVDCSNSMEADIASYRAARCLPIRPCRRRRLLRPPGDARLSAHRKTTLLSTVRCTSCHPPATPCALCTGRLNSSVSLGTSMPSLERTALLDPAFHPVLSFNKDVLTSLRLSECVRHTPLVTSSEPDSELVSCMGKKGLTIKISKTNLKCLPPRSFRSLVRDNSDKYRLANRPDGDYMECTTGEVCNSEIVKSLHDRAALRDAFRRKRRFGLPGQHLGRSVNDSSSRPGRPSRLTQSASSSSLKDALRRQNSRADFDINNVVIPYGATAAATVIDRQEYKEIITPKWREVEVLPLLDKKSSSSSPPAKLPRLDTRKNSVFFTSGDELEMVQSVNPSVDNADACSQDTESEVEDLSDEMFAARHLRYEIYEKKQIEPLLRHRRRSRSNRSESEHSLTASANPRSPDTVGGIGSEAVGESSVFGCTDEMPETPSDVYHLPEQNDLPTVDIKLCRISSSALSALTLTGSVSTEANNAENRTEAVDVCKAGSWPERAFPLVGADYDQLQAAEGHFLPSSLSANPVASASGDIPSAGSVVTDNPELASVTQESIANSGPSVT